MKQFRFFILLLLFVVPAITDAQLTLPAPFNLSSGVYSLSSWDSLAATGTYPANMIFHYTIQPENSTTHVYDSSAEGARDYNCSYNLKARNRVIGLGQNGFAFITTSSAQYNDCIGTASTADTNRYVGAAVLALNTSGKTNIGVKWSGSLVLPGDGNGDTTMRRQYTVRLQYRVGATGHYTDVISNGGPVEFNSANRVTGAVVNLSAVLPAACNNQPVVYLRWIYFSVLKGSGTRPEIAVDDIQAGANLLPLHLLSFEINNTNGVAALSWKTASEVNFSHFEVQRSSDALNYSTIATVAAKDNAGVNGYSFTDDKPGNSKEFYRLKMVDKDGSYVYSDVVPFTTSELYTLSLYPNPVSDHLVLLHPKSTAGAVITIYGYDGRKVTVINAAANTNETNINITALSKGSYVLVFSTDSERMSVRFTKK